VLHVIQTTTDPLLDLVKDDPVRPEIHRDFRVSADTEIFVLLNSEHSADAVVCCAYRSSVPATVEELLAPPRVSVSAAVFYTIWSYRPGAGRRLITAAKSWIEQNRSDIREFVTLSPHSEMARQFHLRNGARVLRVNPDTVNYQYL